jgi:esterase/lipase
MKKDFLIEKDDTKKPLIITFGGIANGLAGPIFEFKNLLKENIDCHKIFIKDSNQSWYHKGANGLGNNINELKNDIEKLIEKINYSEIITIGASMGGYASLLFGSLLKVNSIISFVPQTFIDKETRKKHKDNRWSEQMKSVHENNQNYYNLINLNFTNINTKIIYGKTDLLDTIHAKRMNKHKSIEIIKYNANHQSIFKKLKKDNQLINIIKKSINYQDLL